MGMGECDRVGDRRTPTLVDLVAGSASPLDKQDETNNPDHHETGPRAARNSTLDRPNLI
jgi:hypothetical protein